MSVDPTFVPADEQPRLGEQVVHGGEALTKWHGHRSGWPLCSAQLVLHQTVDSVTPGKALADLAFPLQVSNRHILLRTANVSTA